MPCINDFNRWAKHEPAKLIAALTDGSLPTADLTFAAEIAGQLTEARQPLLTLLEHADPVVREGAVYGLSSFVSDPTIRDRLYQLSLSDPSPAVAMSAAEALED